MKYQKKKEIERAQPSLAIDQCQHTMGGKCQRCQYPMDAYLQSRMRTSLVENMSKPIKVVGNVRLT